MQTYECRKYRLSIIASRSSGRKVNVDKIKPAILGKAMTITDISFKFGHGQMAVSRRLKEAGLARRWRFQGSPVYYPKRRNIGTCLAVSYAMAYPTEGTNDLGRRSGLGQKLFSQLIREFGGERVWAETKRS